MRGGLLTGERLISGSLRCISNESFFLLLTKSKQKREIHIVLYEILKTRQLSNKFLFPH